MRSTSLSNSMCSTSSASRHALIDETHNEQGLSPHRNQLTTAVVCDADVSITPDHGDYILKEVKIVVKDILDDIDGVDKVVSSVVSDMVCQVDEVNDSVNNILDRVSFSLEGGDGQNQSYVVQQVLDDLILEVVDKCEETSIKSIVSEILEEVINNATKSEPDSISARRSSSDHMYAKPSVNDNADNQRKRKQTSVQSTAVSALGMMSRKRRSARVKQTSRKCEESEKVESRDHVADLEEMIPSSLLHEATPEHGYSLDIASNRNDDTITPERPLSTANKESAHKEAKLFEDEAGDVRSFLLGLDEDLSFICVMREWVRAVCDRRGYSWSSALISVYISLYELHRPCFALPNVFSDDHVEHESLPAVVWMEQKVEKLTHEKESEIGRAFEQNFSYWEMLVGCYAKLRSTCNEFSVRFYHMAAQYYLAKCNPDHALGLYRTLLDYLDTDDKPEGEKFSVVVRNCKNFSIISAKSVKDDLALVERTQSLEELQSVYDAAEYDRVIELLALTFEIDVKKRFNDSRQTQLHLLLSTCEKKPDSPEVVRLLVEALHESLHYYDKKQAGAWKPVICSCLKMIASTISGDKTSLLTSAIKVRLVHSCLNVMRLNCKAIECEKQMSIPSVHPWIILSKLMELQPSGDESKQDSFPPSVQYVSFYFITGRGVSGFVCYRKESFPAFLF